MGHSCLSLWVHVLSLLLSLEKNKKKIENQKKQKMQNLKTTKMHYFYISFFGFIPS